MTRYVLDASVAVKWFLPAQEEALTTEALELYALHNAGSIEFIVPDLFWIEFAQVIWKAVRRKRWQPHEAREALDGMLASDLESFAGLELIDHAFTIASTQNCAIYDSIYVALAEQAACDMITADEKLVNALGLKFPVRWLGGMRF